MAAPETFASVMVWVVGGVPSTCAGKVSAVGVRVIGCWQALVLFNARQMFPKSPAVLVVERLPGQPDVATM
jgi:hypothetical protein